jgi:hypothetical protein
VWPTGNIWVLCSRFYLILLSTPNFSNSWQERRYPPTIAKALDQEGCSGPIEWDLRESNPSPGLNWDFKEVLSFLYERAKRPIEDIGTPPKAVSPEKDWKIFTQACSAKEAS